MSADLKINSLVVRVFDVPNYMYSVVLKPVADGKIKFIGIAFQCFCIIDKSKNGFRFSDCDKIKIVISGEAVAPHLVGFAVNCATTVPQTAHDGEENRRASAPESGVTLP